MSVNLKNCYHLHLRSVLEKRMKLKTPIYDLKINPTKTTFSKNYKSKNVAHKG